MPTSQIQKPQTPIPQHFSFFRHAFCLYPTYTMPPCIVSRVYYQTMRVGKKSVNLLRETPKLRLRQK